ncbi:MAG: hypothetical protein E7222_13035 [Clostridiales bacterium]|nr:hypothetical protein [Clostridiales bacterium]
MNEDTFDEAKEGENLNESKANRFKRLASKRVNTAIKQINLIGNLSGSSYEYTDEQVEKMFGTLQAVLDSSRDKFSKSKKRSDQDTFTFD